MAVILKSLPAEKQDICPNALVKLLSPNLYQISVSLKYQNFRDKCLDKDGVRKMALRSQLLSLALGSLVLIAGTVPAHADTKAGVDAWSRGDYDAAVKQWRGPALKGDPDAQFNMGQAYKLGRGVKTDLNIALDWYKKAAAQGHLQAADSCGHLLHYQQRITEALPYLQASSDRGDPRAQYLLATELFNGVHIEKDWVRAYALMTRASSAGMAPASRSLAQMDQYIPLEQRQAASVLAGELEQRASRNRAAQVGGFAIDTTPPPKMAAPVTVPPSRVAAPKTPGFPSDIPVAGAAAKPTVGIKPALAKPIAAAVLPAKTAASDGAWRIQLGAFGSEANAKKLWTSLESKIPALAPLQPYLKASGTITRLQAGPFGSKAAADAMCAKVKLSGQACLAIPRS
jgi:TPR repeat protein